MCDYYYNQKAIKERFLNENGFNESLKHKFDLLFRKTKPYEDVLQKDIFQMTREDCEGLLHFLQLRSVQHVKMYTSNFKYYIYWCDSQGLIPHHINYFEGLVSFKDAEKFIPPDTLKNQIINRKQLNLYTKGLTDADDYQGALIINLLFLGVQLDKNDSSCELRNIKVANVDLENSFLTTSKRLIKMNINLSKLVLNAIEQPEMINLFLKEEIKKPKLYKYNNLDFLVRGRKNKSTEHEPTSYFTVAKKIRDICTFVNNPHTNATYLNLSGIVDYVKNNYTEDYYDKKDGNIYEMYEDLISEFKLSSTKEDLKARLLQFL